MGDFEEQLHPRSHGKFSSKGGESGEFLDNLANEMKRLLGSNPIETLKKSDNPKSILESIAAKINGSIEEKSGNIENKIHVLSTHDIENDKIKVHGIFDNMTDAQNARNAQIAKLYSKFRDDNYGDNKQQPLAVAEQELKESLEDLPTIHSMNAPENASNITLVHKFNKNDNTGEVEHIIHGAYADKSEAQKAANELSLQNWLKDGEQHGPDLSNREAKSLASAYNHDADEDQKIDNETIFIKNDHLHAVADQWNKTHDSKDHVNYNIHNAKFDLKHKLSYPINFQEVGHEKETADQYFARSKLVSDREEQIRKELSKNPDVAKREDANKKLSAKQEEMFPEEQPLPYPGLIKANRYFRDTEKDGGVVDLTSHVMNAKS